MKIKKITMLAIPVLILTTTFTVLHAKEEGHKFNNNNNNNNNGLFKHQGMGKHFAGKSRHNAAGKLDFLTEKLALNPAQESQLKELFAKGPSSKSQLFSQRKDLHQAIRDLDVSSADYPTELAALKQQAAVIAHSKIDSMLTMRQSIQAILTPEQYQKMQEMRSNRDGQHRGGKNPGNHAG